MGGGYGGSVAQQRKEGKEKILGWASVEEGQVAKNGVVGWGGNLVQEGNAPDLAPSAKQREKICSVKKKKTKVGRSKKKGERGTRKNRPKRKRFLRVRYLGTTGSKRGGWGVGKVGRKKVFQKVQAREGGSKRLGRLGERVKGNWPPNGRMGARTRRPGERDVGKM